MNRPDYTKALCAGTDPTLFFLEKGDSCGVKAAKALCEMCPVQIACAEYAIRHERYGIWGGLSEKELRKERARRGITLHTPNVFDDPRCGTEAGYSAHRRRDEHICRECRFAHSRAEAGRERLRSA